MNKTPYKKDIRSGNETVHLEPSDGFVATPYIQDLAERALVFLHAGYSVHFAGPAGTGKTTLAFHVASQLNQPITLIHGDDEYKTSDLIGKSSGYRKHKLVDNYIHSVVKTEERMNVLWEDKRLTTACQNGHILIYDEFTRSKPETNNAFLSVLEEKILNIQYSTGVNKGYLHVHPDFRVIFTSNPEEYAGTHKTQDALMDRLITISIDHIDRETEIAITMSKSSLEYEDARVIVDIIRELRSKNPNHCRPSIRASIAIGKILAKRGGRADLENPYFRQICHDVLNFKEANVMQAGQLVSRPQRVDEAIEKVLESVSKCVRI